MFAIILASTGLRKIDRNDIQLIPVVRRLSAHHWFTLTASCSLLDKPWGKTTIPEPNTERRQRHCCTIYNKVYTLRNSEYK